MAGANEQGIDVSVALQPCSKDAVPDLISEISSLGTSYTDGSEDTRRKLLAKAKDLVNSLEFPRETMIRHCWAEPAAHAAISLGVDIGLWSLMAKRDGPQKVSDLASATGVDPPLLARLMRHLAAMGYLIEVGSDAYKTTNFTKSLSIDIIGNGYPALAGGLYAAVYKFHEYEKKVGYKTPNDVADGSLQHAYDTQLNMFEHLQAHPPYGVYFNHHMGGYRQGRPAWMDKGFYPVEENLIKGFDDGASGDGALIVDIGGSIGHDLQEFQQKFPDHPGRLVLEDLPIVIGQIVKLDEKIERRAYDFYTEQPVKGARAYYMHSVLHDWPDVVCLKILANVTAAMKRGYSRLLINENVIPDTGAQWEATALDIMMLTLLSSKERSRVDWQSLLSQAGLKITNIYGVMNGVESLIECELA